MIYTGKGHIDELQGLCLAQHSRCQRHIGQHDDICVPAPFRLDLRIRVLGIGHEGMTHGFQLPGVLFDHLIGNAQTFQQYDFHFVMFPLNLI